MDIIKTFPGLTGFYTLTSDGQLGAFDRNGKYVVDASLTSAFEDYNRRFLMTYLQRPAQGSTRLAIIYRTQEKQPWGSETLCLEKNLTRRLYPVSGMTAEVDLTAFQKKNREKSIYRGMEIILEYKDISAPEMPMFCPVLFDRDKKLAEYAASLDRPLEAGDRETPVVEVLNMLAGMAAAMRTTPEIGILKEKIYNGIIKKSVRKAAEFTLIEDIQSRAKAALKGSEDDPYGDVDKRSDRQVTLDANASRAAHSDQNNALNSNISSSLVGRPEPADAQTFKRFSRFREMRHDMLERLAEKCLVYKVPPGTQLLERGTSDSMNLYLIEGSVKLVAADGIEKIVEAGTPAAGNPVSFLKPRMYTVASITRVAFLWIDDRMVEDILKTTSSTRRLDGKA